MVVSWVSGGKTGGEWQRKEVLGGNVPSKAVDVLHFAYRVTEN